MDEKKAREILNELGNIQYIGWEINEVDMTLDGTFDADDLEALAWWLRNRKDKKWWKN